MNHYTDIPQTGFVTPQWVKKRYVISNSTLYQWLADKRLASPLKVGPRAVRFRVEDIRVFEAKFSTKNTDLSKSLPHISTE